ncbi:hypothetical protein QEV83_14645 [Methylocapsa sp. D3K7]|uniref:hypothetical protein n=1 Tax=Methylocapsa sp. D3K7 TaxID=3041435 RepID=UPI00244EE7C0|nr:hypothetical protein [Methylocapsa sp. D3K7]WGJ13896.1 hypothetical protein QEV83_14645 [Methylocapsa sp. D3K7]
MHNALFFGEKSMQLPSLNSVMQILISIASLFVTSASLIFSYTIWFEKRNADLVQIGVNVLRVDPDKEKQISEAREWALNLIDANAGGVKFSPEARAQLLRKRLEVTDVRWGNFGWGSGDALPNNPAQPSK